MFELKRAADRPQGAPGAMIVRVLAAALLLAGFCAVLPIVAAQDSGPEPGDAGPSAAAPAVEPGNVASSRSQPAPGLSFFKLFWDAKWFMLPIVAMSIVVVAVTIERFIAMRSDRVLPLRLVQRLGQLSGNRGFDPREAYRACQENPSTASNVIRAMLFDVGRPHNEVKKTVEDACQREAAKMYSNVRWLTLAAAVTPLMGLFGTVWGMIEAFHNTTVLGPEQNKAEQLAGGIYTALVTTLGGLAVAIPAAILAHYFEGQITSLFHRIEEMLFNLLPQVERYEGRVRFTRPDAEGQAAADGSAAQSPPSSTPPSSTPPSPPPAPQPARTAN